MTTDAMYEERGSDWSHRVSAVGTTRLQRDQDPSSLRRVWLVRLSISLVSVSKRQSRLRVYV